MSGCGGWRWFLFLNFRKHAKNFFWPKPQIFVSAKSWLRNNNNNMQDPNGISAILRTSSHIPSEPFTGCEEPFQPQNHFSHPICLTRLKSTGLSSGVIQSEHTKRLMFQLSQTCHLPSSEECWTWLLECEHFASGLFIVPARLRFFHLGKSHQNTTHLTTSSFCKVHASSGGW